MVATSMPASRNAVKAAAGARNVNSLPCCTPPSVIAVSRFTIVRSARRSPGAASANTVDGSRSRRSRTRPVKWTSPAKAIVKRPVAAGEAGDVVVDAVVDAAVEWPPELLGEVVAALLAPGRDG